MKVFITCFPIILLCASTSVEAKEQGRSPAVEDFILIEADKPKNQNTLPPEKSGYNFSQTGRSTSHFRFDKESKKMEFLSFNAGTFLALTFLVFFPFILWGAVMARLTPPAAPHKQKNSEKEDTYDLPKAS